LAFVAVVEKKLEDVVRLADWPATAAMEVREMVKAWATVGAVVPL